MSANFFVRYFESVKKYLVQKIRTRESALYMLLENVAIRETKERDMSHTTAYPVGENHSNIKNSMRAEGSCRDTSALQQKKAVWTQGLMHLLNIKISSMLREFTIYTSVTFLHAETLEHGRAANRRHHMRPWIYGSRFGT